MDRGHPDEGSVDGHTASTTRPTLPASTKADAYLNEALLHETALNGLAQSSPLRSPGRACRPPNL